MQRHEFDGVSFVAGILFAAIGIWFLIPGAPTQIFDNLGEVAGWIWPAALVAIGIAVLVPALTKTRRDPDD